MTYPALARKYGPVVTYEEKPSAHMKVEFGFDVDQVAKGNYAPKAYHDFIGFEVPKPVLERAFARTYSLDMSSVFLGVDLAIGSYRHAVSTVIPRTTKVAWHLKRREIQHGDPSETKTKFIYNISHSGYRKEWGSVYEKPDSWVCFKAFALRLVPKVGPLSGLAFHPPTPAVEQIYMRSFNETRTTIGYCCLHSRKADSNCPTKTSTPANSAGRQSIDSQTRLTRTSWAGRPANPFLTLCVGTFSAITRTSRRDSRPRKIHELGNEYSRNWIR
jgi:hypothetical protein